MLLDPPPGEHPIINIPRAQPPLYPIMYITEYDNCKETKTGHSHVIAGSYYKGKNRVIQGQKNVQIWASDAEVPRLSYTCRQDNYISNKSLLRYASSCCEFMFRTWIIIYSISRSVSELI